MKNLNLRAGLAFSGLCMIFGHGAHATPTLYPENFNLLSQLRNPTNSNLVADDADPRSIYVMPPNAGYATATGVNTLTANLNFCRNMIELSNQTLQLEQKESDLRLQLADQIDAIKALEVRIATASTDLAQYATANHLADLVTIDGDITSASNNLQVDLAAIDHCTSACDALEADVKLQQGTLATLTHARTDFETKNLAAARIYDQKKQVVTALTTQRDSVTGDYNSLLTDLSAADSQIMSLYVSYGAMEGARASFSYDSGWAENIASIRSQNPGFNVNGLNTENAMIYPGILGVQGLPPTGAILGFETPGSATQSGGGISMPAYPTTISGNAVLSLVGACPMVYPNFFQFSPGVTPTSQKFGMLVTYQYPSAMKVSLTATYNMYKMYQLVKDSGSSGGLFSSHSWSHTEERNFFSDAFHVDWITQDPQNQLSDDQRMAEERDVRNDIYSRMYALAIPQAPDKGLLVAASAPGQHGAVVLADGLMTACPGNMYCVAGSLILEGLDAIFGSSGSSSSYTQIQDITLTDTWSMSKAVLKPGITSYSAQ